MLATGVSADEALSPELVQQLKDLRSELKTWAITCPPGPFEGQTTHTYGACAQGDANFTAGISCLAATLAGDEETAEHTCRDVALAQGANGRWWRGPSLVEQPYPGTFSRDQARGTYAYLLARGHVSQDSEHQEEARHAALNWQQWMNSPESNGRICTDNKRSCEFTWGAHNMAYNVFRHIGALHPWEHDPLTRRFYRSDTYLTFAFKKEIPLLFFETQMRGKWYPVHLKAISTLMYRVMNIDYDNGYKIRNRRMAKRLGQVAASIHRFDLDNAFYDFLRNGIRKSMVDKVIARCPKGRPDLTHRGNWHDWSWQRTTKEKAWERSDGHDYIFMINLILARLQGRLNW